MPGELRHAVFVLRISEGEARTGVVLRIESVVVLVLFMVVLVIHSQQVESTARLDFLWKVQVSVFFSSKEC